MGNSDSSNLRTHAVPGEENPPSCNDIFYNCGDKMFKAFPMSVRGECLKLAPGDISSIDGGVERACCCIATSQIICAIVYFVTFSLSFVSCGEVEYISLGDSKLCDEVPLSIVGNFEIDSNGFWDTANQFSFAKSQLSAFFLDFYTSTSDWPDTYARGLSDTYTDWNRKWQFQPMTANLISMVASESRVDGDDAQIILARVLASPDKLMDTTGKSTAAVNFGNFPSDFPIMNLNYQDIGGTVEFSSTPEEFGSVFPGLKFPEGSFYNATTASFRLNKISIWIASAVNMGIIKIGNLTNLRYASLETQYESDTSGGCYIPSYFNDGFCDPVNNFASCSFDGGDCCESTCDPGREFSCGSAGYSCQDPDAIDYNSTVYIDDMAVAVDDDLVLSADDTDDEHSIDDDDGNAHGYNRHNLEEYVLFKYRDRMDPIGCATIDSTDYCWVSAGRSVTENNGATGAYFFPTMQPYFADCDGCPSTADDVVFSYSFTTDDDFPYTSEETEYCSTDVDIAYLMYFNPKHPTVPHYLERPGNDRPSYNVLSGYNEGVFGLIYMNLYGQIEFLNDNYYPFKDLHCQEPIGMISAGSKSLQCGSDLQVSLMEMALRAKGPNQPAEIVFCAAPPVKPQEQYYRCRNSAYTCFSGAVASASGQVGVAILIMSFFIVFIAQKCLGVPSPVEVLLAGRKVRSDSHHGDAKSVEMGMMGKGTRM